MRLLFRCVRCVSVCSLHEQVRCFQVPLTRDRMSIRRFPPKGEAMNAVSNDSMRCRTIATQGMGKLLMPLASQRIADVILLGPSSGSSAVPLAQQLGLVELGQSDLNCIRVRLEKHCVLSFVFPFAIPGNGHESLQHWWLRPRSGWLQLAKLILFTAVQLFSSRGICFLTLLVVHCLILPFVTAGARISSHASSKAHLPG